jgi:amino acid permease
MIEGKLAIKNCDLVTVRVLIRVLLCGICTFLAGFVPGFVHVISFVGCFCVSILGFVLPPLLRLKLTKARSQSESYASICLLFVGAATTVVTSSMTFWELVEVTQNSKASHYVG